MPSAPLRPDEDRTLAALAALEVLDTAAEAEFDALVAAAAAVCGVPISLISLIDIDRQWFKASVGLPGVTETPRELAFCAHAVLDDGIFEVPDASRDARFADNPLVTGQPDIRFYAGAPLTLSDGSRIGTLCVIDRAPRRLDPTQRHVLRQLSIAAAQMLEGRVAIRRSADATRRLAESESNLRLVVDHVPSMLAYWNEDLSCRFANRSYEHWFGVTTGALVGRSALDFLGPELYAVNLPYLTGALQGVPQTFERELVHAAGTPRQCLVQYVPDLLDGRIRGFLAQVSDVTALKDAQAALRTSQDFLQRTGAVAGIGGWEVDLRTGVATWSDEVCRIHGVAPGFRPTVEQGIAFYDAPSRPLIQAAVAEAIAGHSGFDLELAIVRADGERRAVRAVGTIEVVDGTPVRLSGAFQDITERARLASELAEQHELLRVTLQSIGDAVITTDAQGRVTWMNPIAERMTGWPADEARGLALDQVFRTVHEETRLPTGNTVTACLSEPAPVDRAKQTLLVSRDGREFGIEDSGSPIRNQAGEVLGAVVVFHDVSEQRRLSGEMRYRATHDALTGLVNRAEFEARLARSLRKAQDEHSEHALLYIDLDQFKLVNDACGHSVGDQLLQQMAKLLGEAVRTRDTLARLGGDEFAIILEHCSPAQAQRIAQKICDRMDDFRFVHEGRRFRVGTSIGLVPLDRRWAGTAALQQAADTSCYAAKEAGRNRVHAWFDTDAAMQKRQVEMQWTSRIETALDHDGFALFAQRIAPLGPASAGVHAELLLRLKNDDGSLAQPGAFLPAAERFHLISRIDRWVLRHAIDWLRTPAAGAGIGMLAVNLSGQSVGDRSFHRWAIEALDDAGPALRRKLCLEITETSAITQLADAGAFIASVRAAGVKVALDDFGAGASSFGYLKTLAVDYLKIDGQFIRDLVTDTLDDAAVRCFSDVAKRIGVETIAEFVETPAVLARLREIGVDHAQGFLIHRPEPIDALLVAAERPLAAVEAGGA